MGCRLKDLPEQIGITLDYPYLAPGNQPTHYFPRRLSHEQIREMREELFGADGQVREPNRAIFHWWSKFVVEDKTLATYEGLAPDTWKEDLWADPEGQFHVLHAVQGYMRAIMPRSFFGG